MQVSGSLFLFAVVSLLGLTRAGAEVPSSGCCSLDGLTCLETTRSKCLAAKTDKACRKKCKNPAVFFLASDDNTNNEPTPPTLDQEQGIGPCCTVDGTTCLTGISARCDAARNTKKCKKKCGDVRAYFMPAGSDTQPTSPLPPTEEEEEEEPSCCTLDGSTCFVPTRRVAKCARATNTQQCRKFCKNSNLKYQTLVDDGDQATPTTPTPPTSNADDDAACSTARAAALVSCNAMSNDSDRDWCRAWLEAHNTRRCRFHQQHQQTPILLQWSMDLMAHAEEWANHLESMSGGDGCVAQHPNQLGNMGENLAWGSSSDGEWIMTPQEVLEGWWDEEERDAVQGRLNNIFHFTQAAWYTTDQVGCSMYTNPDSSYGANQGACHVHICRYYVRGNCNMRGNWLAETLEGDRSCSELI